MTEEQKQIIRGYDFPKIYKLFYKWYTRWIGTTIFSTIVIAGLIMIIFGDIAFDVVLGVFFFGIALVLFSLLAKSIKTIHLKRYLKKVGMSLTEWNSLTQGLTIDDIKKI
jgi:hypothetical protein